MTNLTFELRDVRLNDVRSACAAFGEALARLPETSEMERALHARWAELLAALHIEPARVLRACPVCKGVGMAEATRCGHCWAKLTALAPVDAMPA